jgi:hypothetical protein
MNSLTIWLYASSVVVIGLLAAFAAHNRRVGWKKSRITLAEALDDLYADLGLSVEPQQEVERNHVISAQRVGVAVDPTDFSDQLICLSKALGEAASVTPNEAKTGAAHMVPVQAR